jgi:alpha-tubulin suppressor-like RCC1 family protein
LTTNALKCWGENYSGQLGLGDTAVRGDAAGEMGESLPVVNLGSGRTVKMVSLGFRHACAILDNNQLKCWGENVYGELGLGDSVARGDQPGEMGDALPPVSLGTSRFAKAVYAGSSFTCAILDNNSVKCWGFNSFGALGLGDTVVRGDGPGEMGDSLPTVQLGTGRTVLSMAAGGGSSCALLDNRALKCWGSNHLGELGLGDTSHRGDAPGEMGDNLPIVRFGDGLMPRQPDPAAPQLTTVSHGAHACVILQTGQVKCWGSNGWGQLGVGDTQRRGDAPGEMGSALPIAQLGPEL